MGFFCGLVGALVLGIVSASPSAPVQLHLALGYTPSTMAVAWATYDTSAPGPGSVTWSLSSDLSSSSTATGDVRPFTVDKGRVWYTHTANMTGLKPSTRYFYQVTSANGEKSKVYSYKTQPDATTIHSDLPNVHLIFGDMGASHAFTLCSTCTGNSSVCDATTCASANQSAGLISEIAKSNHIVHTGDFAYNLEDEGGTVGDQFMVNIEQVAANVPYMTSIGNHEDNAGNIAHYTERFRHMPSNSGFVTTSNTPSTAPNNWYFSWDAGLVHYIAMSTELYFGVKSDPAGTLKAQYEFIEADLQKANANRANVPWIVVHGHRSIYCSCDGDCDASATIVRDGIVGQYGMEELFFKYGVDFFFNGHEHDYERSWPVYKSQTDQSNVNPKGTIYVVTGAAGSKEMHEPFTRAQPKWSALRSNTFGYSKMTVYNHTHVHWQQIQTDPTLFGPELYGRVVDDTWVIQNNHGPFSKDDPPSGWCPKEGCSSGVSYDHWLPLLDLDTSSDHTHAASAFAGKEYELIAKYREQQGDGQWKRTEVHLLAKAQAALGGKLIWEDVHEDGNSDGKWANETWVRS